VLLVGAGNSGVEIAMDLRGQHPLWVSGPSTGEVPYDLGSWLGRTIIARLVLRVVFHRLLTVNTWLGRKIRASFIAHGAPLIRTKSAHLAAAGVERVGRTVGVRDGRPLLEDGRALDVANVVWCTGFTRGLDWIDLPIFDELGEPRYTSGVVTEQPGLYFVGQHFLHAASSGMIHGVGRDAARIAAHAAARAAVVPVVEHREAAIA
jgi:putative flavoprotein involved in K+ transport